MPREVQITLMTKEIHDMNELERILDVLQSTRDREVGRRPQQQNNNNKTYEHDNYRSNPSGHGGTHINNFNNPEDWRCSRRRGENYASRQKCFRCSQARDDQRRREGDVYKRQIVMWCIDAL